MLVQIVYLVNVEFVQNVDYLRMHSLQNIGCKTKCRDSSECRVPKSAQSAKYMLQNEM